MDDYQQLKSKYDRLCVEFKKLRTKYKTLKDSENELNQQLQEKILQKDLHVEKLQCELEQLKLHNALIEINNLSKPDLTETAHSLPEQNSLCSVVSAVSTNFIPSSSLNVCYNDARNTYNASSLNTVSNNFLPSSEIPISSSLSDLSTTTAPTSPHLPPSSSNQGQLLAVGTEEKLIEQFVQLLNNWMSSLKTYENVSIIDKEKLDSVLISRIAQLESQLCSVSLQCQLERKRRLKEQQQSEITDDNKFIIQTSNQGSNVNVLEQLSNDNEKSKEISTLHKSLIRRLHETIEESIYFASRANLLQDELESLVPWILQLVNLNQKQQFEIKTINEYNKVCGKE
ncbi:hypothetical protein MN116_007452 [Schistosoma mekongi]|uniref:Uncharacterized protein n=1 Tax=Schistosoma mekongi TaxID=38744 RepID=A0AAE1Z9V5_SCHME|nr:hypothetical protein MN116_007452 [Schistosoma mekongi]